MKREKWLQFKKDLPKNWAQQVSETLEKNGFTLSATQVSQVRMGVISNIEWQEKVWAEINVLKTDYVARKKRLEDAIAIA